MRIGKLQLMIPDCPHCGYPVVVNGFGEAIICESCRNPVGITDAHWGDIFGSMYRQTRELVDETDRQLDLQLLGPFQVRATAAGVRAIPCAGCGQPLDVSRIDAGSQSLHCRACGCRHGLTPLPASSRAHEAAFAVGEASHPVGGRSEPIAPIAMNCPSCAATLKIGSDSERITTCDFCRGEFLVPDPLWKRLHPVKTVAPWYVLFDQPPPPAAEELEALAKQREAEAKAQAERAQARDRRHKLEGDIAELDRRIARERSFFSVSTGGGYFVAVMAGIFLIGFPILFIPPLSEVVGAQLCDGRFSVSTTQHAESTSYNYYCAHGGAQENFDIFALYAIVIGVVCMCALWTAYYPVRRYKLRATVRPLEEERNELQVALLTRG